MGTVYLPLAVLLRNAVMTAGVINRNTQKNWIILTSTYRLQQEIDHFIETVHWVGTNEIGIIKKSETNTYIAGLHKKSHYRVQLVEVN